VYTYPPGPNTTADARRRNVSRVKVTLSHHVDETRLRELFGRFDVFEDHRGIAELTLEMPPETAHQKKQAEEAFERWFWESNDAKEYEAASAGESFFDQSVAVELAPGEYLEETIAAGALPVPPPKPDMPPGATPLERIRHANRTHSERQVIQLGYFPNVTSAAPPVPGPRPPIRMRSPAHTCARSCTACPRARRIWTHSSSLPSMAHR
jgi:large subunit ribosomal protein L47